MALFYIAFYNLIAPRMSSGRRYVDEVKSFLATRERRVAGDVPRLIQCAD